MNSPAFRDILLPADSLWWPPAPGWWLLPGLLLLALLTWWLLRRRRNPPLAKLCLRELEAIRRARAAGQDDRATINAVARLLRRTLISHQGRLDQAATTGEAWVQQLAQLAPQHGFSETQLRLLAYDRYRGDARCDIDALLQSCEGWIRNLPRGGPRVSA